MPAHTAATVVMMAAKAKFMANLPGVQGPDASVSAVLLVVGRYCSGFAAFRRLDRGWRRRLFPDDRRDNRGFTRLTFRGQESYVASSRSQQGRVRGRRGAVL